MDAWLGGAAEQLMGQIASAKIPLSRMISPQLYWVMSDSEFTLDINNPEEPKILCVGNNPDRQNIYEGENETYIEASVENSSSILYDKEIRNKPRTRRTKRNV